MTDYNDGEWHGWNGGDCPVHPETVVEVALNDSPPVAGEIAEQWYWGGDKCRIIAFRVTKPYREPRTFYVNEYPNSTIMPHLYCSEVDAGIGAGKNRVRAVKLIEVIE